MKDNAELIDTSLSEEHFFDTTAIISAIKEDDSNTIKKYLNKNLFNDFLDEDENTPIHIAVIRKNRKSLLLFLEHGMSPNQINSSHLTPLHIAVNQKDIKSAKLLLKFGADKEAIDNNGKSATELAEENQFDEFLNLASKVTNIPKRDSIVSANYDNCVESLLENIKSLTTPKKRVSITSKVISECLNIDQELLRELLDSHEKKITSQLSNIFVGIKNTDQLSREENLKLVRKYISTLNSLLLHPLNEKEKISEIQKLSKLEKISEDKIIYFASENTIKPQLPSVGKAISVGNQIIGEPETLKKILEGKCAKAEKLSPYNFLDYDNQQIICRQINKEMCFIDKITIKTHSPISTLESEAIINACEEDIAKENVKNAKKAIKGNEKILLLANSRNFDEALRPGKIHNVHLVYFCSHNESYEENLDKLSRISLCTGCTVHSFNYPGINNSSGHVDEAKDMIYAGLATVNLLLEKGISLDKIVLFSDSESYTIIKNVVRQFFLEELKVNRFGIIDLSLEHNKRKFKPTNLRKSLLYFNPNQVDLALYSATTKEEKLTQCLNESIFYDNKPELFKKSDNNPSVMKKLKEYIQLNQECLKKNSELRNPDSLTVKIDTVKGEIQV